jgi:peroxiredoxin
MYKSLGGVLVIAALVSACGEENASGPGAKNPGDVSTSSGQGSGAGGATASDFTARDTEGKTVKLSQYLGKSAILLNFCATWCEPCVAEFPHLRRMYDANKDKGLVILAVAMDGPETSANVAPFARRQQLNFPMLLDEDSHIASLYNPKKAAPLSVLIDKQGRIFKVREGYNPGDEEYLAKDVAKVLDGSGASK